MNFLLRFTAWRWLLPALVLALPVSPAMAKPAKMLDIADTVNTTRILSQFAAVIQAADLGTFLSSRGPFTLFAPTDAAFSKIPPATLAALLRPENKERLQDILLFHVVNGKRLSSKDMLTVKSVLSCAGSPTLPLAIKTTHSGAQLVQKAKIVHADIRCENGFIHEIDTVLMPPESSLPPLAPPPPSPTPTPTAAVNSTNAAPLSPDPPGVNGTIPVAPTATPGPVQ